jgi:hypothetical protein
MTNWMRFTGKGLLKGLSFNIARSKRFSHFRNLPDRNPLTFGWLSGHRRNQGFCRVV